MILRREVPGDRRAIAAVHTASFAPRGGGGDVREAKLVDDLRDDGEVIPALSVVATVGNEVVGHVVCSRAHIDQRLSLGLGPLGVLPPFQGQGIGAALMHAVVAAADALDEPAVVLLGDPGYYRQFGFVLAEAVGVLPPDPGWADHLQIRCLTVRDTSTRWTFRYATAFNRL